MHQKVYKEWNDANSNGTVDSGAIQAVDKQVLVDFKLMTGLEYDARHNMKKQLVITYGEVFDVWTLGATDRTALDVQEIRSFRYHASGTAAEQVIVTYEGLDGSGAPSSLVEAKHIFNYNILTNS